MKQNIIKRLSDREHLLQKPSMYIGGIHEIESDMLMIINGKLEYQSVRYNPGLWKIIDEIFANSIDEYIRTNGSYSKNITVTFNVDQICISDDGRGIPQDLIDDIPMAVIAVTEARAGTNFDVETKADASIGTNGVGSFATNIFSKEFIMDTYDGENHLNLICTNNMETIDWKIKASKQPKGTTIKFKPDLSRFSISTIDEIYPIMIANAMTHLSQVFDIKFVLVNNIKSTKLEDLF
jgi:DNA topoisomerase-2